MRSTIISTCFICYTLFIHAQSANVGINTLSPHVSAALDITSTSKGVLIPRVDLVAANLASPVTSPANALLVYNNATSGEGDNRVIPGFYYWSSDRNRWVQMDQEPSSDNGLGTWGDCAGSPFTHYNPVGASVIAQGFHGYSVAMDDAFAIGGAPYDSSGAFAYAGSAWIYKRNGQTWSVFQELPHNEPETFQLFGISVAIDGDYAVVGTAGDDKDEVEDVGAVYIFHFNGTSWLPSVKLEPEESVSNMLFGYDVAIDSHRVVIGAPGAQTGGMTTGAAYVYERTGSTWALTQTLVASDIQSGDHLGLSVAAQNDMVLLGAPRADINGESNAGAAYFFRYSFGSWEEIQKKQATTPLGGNEFGRAVWMDQHHSIIGIPGLAVNGQSQQGGAIVYRREGNLWQYVQTLHNTSGNSGDEFGSSVSIDGIYAMVGSPNGDVEGGSFCGEVSVFTDIGGIWKRIAQHIHDPTCESGDQFGSDVILQDKQFMIGAPGMLEKGLVVFGKL